MLLFDRRNGWPATKYDLEVEVRVAGLGGTKVLSKTRGSGLRRSVVGSPLALGFFGFPDEDLDGRQLLFTRIISAPRVVSGVIGQAA